MPRKSRFQFIGVPQHVIQRGNNRQACFFNEADYLFFLEVLLNAAKKNDCQVHAYVLMTNHVHLLVTPGQAYGISSMMQSIGLRYVRYINKTYRRTGTLWEGRYKSSLVQSERYLLTCYRYIELNPVRAGMVSHPGEYRWSSYGANAQGAVDDLLFPHDEYHRLGQTVEDRLIAYRELFRYQLDSGMVDDIREALNHELVVGTDRFKDEIEAMTRRKTRMGHPGRPKKK